MFKRLIVCSTASVESGNCDITIAVKMGSINTFLSHQLEERERKGGRKNQNQDKTKQNAFPDTIQIVGLVGERANY